jgi:hypothetical protein
MILPKYSVGIGDRFGRQGRAQLEAVVRAQARGVEIAPVWNKSNREHLITGTHPESVRAEADAAVATLGWHRPYFVDADHITLKTVDRYIGTSDFFTIDVADFVGKPAPEADIRQFVARYRRYAESNDLPGTPTSVDDLAAAARKFLMAIREAGAIYRRIEAAKGRDSFVTEVSIDETDEPQAPADLFFILAAVAAEGIPLQTIAPKFIGRFNKGIDYAGDVARFELQFGEHIDAVALAVREFGLPPTLKLSVHSGSDKFSIYGPMARMLRRHDAGVHLKTAGTTWLEEVAGLAQAGGTSLRLAQDIYAQAYGRIDELCGPYAAVIDIDRTRLPQPETVRGWSSEQYVTALRHDETSPSYNPHFRQLLHVGFRVAAEMGPAYLQALDANAGIIGSFVAENLLDRHIVPLFGELTTPRAL